MGDDLNKGDQVRWVEGVSDQDPLRSLRATTDEL